MVDDSGSGYEPEGGSEGLSSGEENGSATQEWGETSPGGEDTFLALMEETDVDTSVDMSKTEHKVSMYTMMATLTSAATYTHGTNKTSRTHITYILPFVDKVCRVAFWLA
ncbi:hypothetical protein Pcac1_g12102 [Phytophthora cactorum]|uniref:Uncharacterized protein n=1 Tax=Phytophthora cactorum TaxID=29920 RepID=A0A8T1CH58_9STRA|nr:hypothetical protein Pcac1_g12102 [Phytophthora cactorum]KAG2923333.1 hypothetical protein PC115_g8981 [Phytophthora cactorum]